MSAIEKAIIQAKQYGKQAFANGLKSVPAQDNNLRNLIAVNQSNIIGSSLPLIEAWAAGFHEANLKRN